MRIRLLIGLGSLLGAITAQAQNPLEQIPGEIHGNFQFDGQYYQEDSIIGADAVPEKFLMNGFANVNYTKGNFRAGFRYESYLNPLLGYPIGFKGQGIPYRYAGYTVNELDVTIGNFYEQFGSGMILRSYEERTLGVDNAFDGFRIRYNPISGVYLKGLVGKQRLFFENGPGIVRGLDGEVMLNELVNLGEKVGGITLGGSFVSKYQTDEDPLFVLPENVSAYAGRISVNQGKFSFFGEYVYKYNDPSTDNRFIYQQGQAALLNLGYSKRGLGINIGLKSTDNMSFRSDRSRQLNNLLINYIPAFTKQHTYNLAATLYPYNTQLNGEFAYQMEVYHKIKRDSWLGGKYGMDIAVNFSETHSPDRVVIDDLESTRLGHRTNLMAPVADIFPSHWFGSESENSDYTLYFTDFNVELKRRLSKKFKMKLTYIHLAYNNDISLGVVETQKEFKVEGVLHADIAVADITHKINRKNSLRYEIQHLSTDGHRGNWGTILVEYNASPHWFVAVMDQYNYGNPLDDHKIHYYYGSVGYVNKGNRYSLSYGRQRAGVFCVGGVCRNVPASSGLAISITSTF